MSDNRPIWEAKPRVVPTVSPAAIPDRTLAGPVDSGTHDDTQTTVSGARASSSRRREIDRTKVTPDAPLDGVTGLTEFPDASNRYRLTDELGRGGMGVVYRAVDTNIGRQVAVKLLRDGKTKLAILRFLNEGRITGQLEHPNIVPVHEIGRDAQGRLFFTMKLVKGRSLKALLCDHMANNRQDPKRLRQRLDVFYKVCDAVSYAHSQGVIHRDLKPENIMVGEFGEVLVMDWGLAKRLRAPSESAIGVPGAEHEDPAHKVNSPTAATTPGTQPALTQQGQIAGTPAYMSPEQAQGDVIKLDERTDIYALGAILYELLTFTPPYRGAPAQILRLAARGHVERPRRRAAVEWGRRAPLIPLELEAIALKAMQPEPRHRYQTVRDLQADLEAFATNERVSACPDSAYRMILKWAKRNPATALGVGLALVFACVLSVVITVLQQQSERELAAEAARTQAAELSREAEAARRQAAEFAAREERLRTLAQQGEIANLQEELGIKVRDDRNDILREFLADRDAALAAGQLNNQFLATIPDLKRRRYIEALEKLVAVSDRLKRRLYEPWDLVTLGMLYHQGRDSRKAIDWYNRMAGEFPDIAQTYNNRGNAKRALNDLDGAIADYNLAIEKDPTGASPYLNRGAAFQTRGDLEAAIRDYNRALELQPGMIEAYHNRGQCYRSMGNVAFAVRDLSEALRRNPRYLEAWCTRGQLYIDLGELERAIADFEAAVAIAPTDVRIWVVLGTVKVRTGRMEEGIADLQRAYRLTTDDTTRRQIADRLRQWGAAVPR